MINLAVRAVMVAFVLLAPAALAQNGAPPAANPAPAKTPDRAEDAKAIDPDPGARGPGRAATSSPFTLLRRKAPSFRAGI
jgi:hypothetical protein